MNMFRWWGGGGDIMDVSKCVSVWGRGGGVLWMCLGGGGGGFMDVSKCVSVGVGSVMNVSRWGGDIMDVP